MYHHHSALHELLVSIMPRTTLQTVFALLCAIVMLFFYLVIRPLLHNRQIAKTSGLPFVIVPWYIYNQPTAYILSRFMRNINLVFSNSNVISWQRLGMGGWPLKLRHAPFTHLKSDTFWTVSPGGLILNIADAAVIHDIQTRNLQFPKATKIYKGIGVYGQNIVSSDGTTWAHHRASILAAKAFGDGTNRLVWKETIERMQDTLKRWSTETVHNIQRDTSCISLDVMGRAALGQSMVWTHAIEIGEDARSLARGSRGYTMTFSSALKCVASNAIAIAALRGSMMPWQFLKWLPKTSKMCEAYENWGFYMRDMIAAKKMDKDPDPSANRATDLLELLCQSQDRKSLSDSEVLGNLFVFIIAGHETSASSLHMTILLLALHPQFQKDIQRELEDVFQGRPPSQWTYENDFHRLCNCLMLMAAWNEEMRLVAPIMSIPKVVCSTPQQIEVDRQTIMIPANTIIRLCVPSVHTNSRYWPHNLPSDPANPVFQHDNVNNDLEEYNPRRWLENDISESAGFSNSPTSQHLFNPVKGSFVPFSAGARSCLGQKFAKVEILTALAMIFSTYSVELATDEFAEDTQVAEMSTESKREIWGKAAEKARNCWQNKMTCSFTVHMNEDVPLKFVKKGKENFFGI